MAATYTHTLAANFGASKSGQSANVVAKVYDPAGTLQATVTSWTEETDAAGNGLGSYAGTFTANPAWAGGRVKYYIVGLTGVGYAETFYAAAAQTSTGAGDTAVNHDTGGADNLRLDVLGVGLDGATVLAYLTTDYTAGNVGSAYVKGQTTTGAVNGVSGRWLNPLYLTAGNSYTIVFSKEGELQAVSKAVSI